MPQASLVQNLATGVEVAYSLPPREALLACYAQYVKGDWSTWDYSERYRSLEARESDLCSFIGDWATFKDGSEG